MHALSPPGAPHHPTVLIVDDHEDTREMLKLLLSLEQVTVVEAKDGNEAYDFAVKESPDLIFMDLTLPKVDGLAATRKIRQDKRIGRTPIIFLSGRAEPAGRIAAYEAGCDGFLVKPIDVDEVLNMVKLWARTVS